MKSSVISPATWALGVFASLHACPASAQADPARGVLACSGFRQANDDEQRDTFIALGVGKAWLDVARADAAVARRLGGADVAAVVVATAADRHTRLDAFIWR